VISSGRTKPAWRDLDYEKKMRFGNLRDDHDVLKDVTTWRQPDVVFDHYCAIDLGNKDSGTLAFWSAMRLEIPSSTFPIPKCLDRKFPYVCRSASYAFGRWS